MSAENIKGHTMHGGVATPTCTTERSSKYIFKIPSRYTVALEVRWKEERGGGGEMPGGDQ